MKRDWLIALRKKQKLKQREIAEMAGISRVLYTRIEIGDKNPSVKNAKKLGTTLGFDWTKLYEDQVQ